jgi:Flp pilus assembly protein TadD
MLSKLFGGNGESAESLKNQGNLALQGGQLEQAEALYRRAIAVDAAYMPAHYNLGNVLRSTARLTDALAAYERAAQLVPDDYEIHVNRGVTLNAMSRYGEAVAAFDTAAALAPDALEPPLNKGVALDRCGRHEEAIQVWSDMLARDRSCSIARYYRSMAYLLLGQTRQGFLEHESRLDLPGYVPHDLLVGKEEWDGGALDGKTLLIYPEQGMGDMLQFLRYVSVCKQRGARTMVVCHPPLASLLETAPEIDLVVPDGTPLPEDYAAYISVLSLPYALGMHHDVPPLPLRVASEPVAQLAQARGLKVGVCWKGNRKHDRDAERSIDQSVFWRGLAGIPGVSFFSLQLDEEAGEHAVSLAPRITDFSDTANLVQQLDLVVTVDTSVAHLCGSLGVPTWVLVTYSPDWRWGLAGETTPWYPSVKLLRQPAPGDWASVLAEVKKGLQNIAS